jgi:hypothetical protein
VEIERRWMRIGDQIAIWIALIFGLMRRAIGIVRDGGVPGWFDRGWYRKFFFAARDWRDRRAEKGVS